MDRKKLVKILAYLIFFILIVNFIAHKFYWYFSVWYFDIIMHFLSGFWIGLAFIYLFSPKNGSFFSVFKVLLFVFFVGVGWEIFEIFVNDIITQNSFDFLDTISDLFFDLIGGALAVLYFFKKNYVTIKGRSLGKLS